MNRQCKNTSHPFITLPLTAQSTPIVAPRTFFTISKPMPKLLSRTCMKHSSTEQPLTYPSSYHGANSHHPHHLPAAAQTSIHGFLFLELVRLRDVVRLHEDLVGRLTLTPIDRALCHARVPRAGAALDHTRHGQGHHHLADAAVDETARDAMEQGEGVQATAVTAAEVVVEAEKEIIVRDANV